MGLRLNAMVYVDSVHVYPVVQDYLSLATYYQSNETYDVTGFVYGWTISILEKLESKLNFTSVLFTRKDKSIPHT